MQKITTHHQAVFVLSLAALLLGRNRFRGGQALALITGQGDWLAILNDAVKGPACIAASVCAIAGFLLSYKRQKGSRVQTPQQEARRMTDTAEARPPTPPSTHSWNGQGTLAGHVLGPVSRRRARHPVLHPARARPGGRQLHPDRHRLRPGLPCRRFRPRNVPEAAGTPAHDLLGTPRPPGRLPRRVLPPGIHPDRRPPAPPGGRRRLLQRHPGRRDTRRNSRPSASRRGRSNPSSAGACWWTSTATARDQGEPIDHAAGQPLSLELIQAAIQAQSLAFRPGDILMLHTGWCEWFLALPPRKRTDPRQPPGHRHRTVSRSSSPGPGTTSSPSSPRTTSPRMPARPSRKPLPALRPERPRHDAPAVPRQTRHAPGRTVAPRTAQPAHESHRQLGRVRHHQAAEHHGSNRITRQRHRSDVTRKETPSHSAGGVLPVAECG